MTDEFNGGFVTVAGLALVHVCVDCFTVLGLVIPPAATGTITKSGVCIFGRSTPNQSWPR